MNYNDIRNAIQMDRMTIEDMKNSLHPNKRVIDILEQDIGYLLQEMIQYSFKNGEQYE
jgi:hypothetical protein